MAQKSTWIAYLLFFTGGIFAWHLLYLKRSRQAVLYCCTFGGFGMGLLYDLFNIPNYVSQANLEEDFVDMHMTLRRRRERLDIAWERCLAEFVFGCLTGYGIISAVPDTWLKESNLGYYFFVCVVAPLAVSYGVWFVGGIGAMRVDYSQSLLGSVLTLPFLLRSGPADLYISVSSSIIFANFRGNRMRALEEINLEQKESYFFHLLKFGVFLSIMYFFLFATIYNNTTITLADGVEVPVSEAVHNFINSQAFKDLKTVLADVFRTLFNHGPHQAWNRFIRISDPLGEDAAFETLELEPGTSEAEIERQCRKLLKEHHPDRFSSEEEKKIEHEKFLNIQTACNRLSSIRQRRIQRNRQSVTKEEL